jgi:hypothetical protein
MSAASILGASWLARLARGRAPLTLADVRLDRSCNQFRQLWCQAPAKTLLVAEVLARCAAHAGDSLLDMFCVQ